MLKLYIGELKDSVKSGNGYFDNWIDQSVIMTDFSRKVIKEVDRSDVISENIIMSSKLGAIPPSMLSGGSKSLMILMYSDTIMKLSCMGDNCLKFLTDIAEVKDFTVNTDYLRNVFCGGLKECLVLNTNKIVFSQDELREEYNRVMASGVFEKYFTGWEWE